MYLFQYVNDRFQVMSCELWVRSEYHPLTVLTQNLNLVVENIGVEPMTSCVQGRRSSQLS